MTHADLPTVLNLIEGMFGELGSPAFQASWRGDVEATLETRLWADAAAFVAVDRDDQLVAVAVGLVEQRMPSPRRPDGRVGYVEWLATDPAHRRQGAATAAMQSLLNWFQAAGVSVVDVHASQAAEPLYRALGFGPAAIPLRLHL